MSLYGMMRTGVSGMNAQVNRLSAVAENIANASTAGYKRASTQFASLVLPSTDGQYNSGSVKTEVRYGISDQGGIRSTASSTDLAIDGNGFFVVSNANGTPYLTRSGSFVADPEGNLYNTAGYYLMGYPVVNGQVNSVANGFQGLEKINVAQMDLVADPSRTGKFTVNLPADADAVTAPEAGANDPDSSFTNKTSLVAYDNLGKAVVLDVYFSKTADNQWEVAVYNAKDAQANGGFPYASGPLETSTMTFDAATGKLTGGSNLTGGKLAIDIPGGQTLNLDLSDTKQLAGKYTVYEANIDGQGPSAIKSVDIGADGSVVALYENGSQREIYRIPLGNVASPDNMKVLSGNVYAPSEDSGGIQLGFPQDGGLGSISSGALEESNADIAEELTEMIEAQRSYTANSKAFQTGADLMDVLVNLKR
ncbi:flagellar biosynthesis protein FlgE [Paramesorhizobium deserti]|uniref:Flagellar hook protein FlgE n=1 Tax=Paramesorhizobium deserti TaxID=1494590 RepID=A0A135HTB9_9HYPH|nr:flagellar hook protein FlgE [Paramesorhizobium deserti]KXF76435.1 flagellar biosynthesis protein FlgE [Paramesorhizobium deserti]